MASAPNAVPTIRAAGLLAASMGGEFDEVRFLLARLPNGVSPPEAWTWPANVMRSVVARTWALSGSGLVDELLALAGRWRPDVVVSEPMEVAGRMAAGTLNLPAVRYRLGPDWFTGPFETTLAKYTVRACRRLGLGGGLPEPALILDPCPPGLQIPGVPSGWPVRFVPYNGSGVLPPWATEPPATPRVCVSLGTLVLKLNGVPLLHRVVEALAELPVEVIVAIPAEDRALTGPLPAPVRVVESVPLQLFLSGCSLVVHHGGAGTGMTTVAAGLPHLVLPQFADQFAFGERVAACGAGLSLADVAAQADVATIRDSAQRLLEEPGYRASAASLGDQVARMPTPAQLVHTLHDLVRGFPPENRVCVSS
jgi:UDP:flavonoid glycosyltransferase YjiC (YdhE family)